MNRPLPQALCRRLASLGAAPNLLVCSDYDGTLAPLALRPELARLLPGASDLLHRLASLPGTRVAIVSGRARDDLQRHSGLGAPILLAGSHGAELPGLVAEGGTEIQSRLDALEAALFEICAASAGAWLERKPLGIAVHVREADPINAARVLAAVREGPARWPALHVTEGKAIIELSLSRSGKGNALRWLRDDWGTSPKVLYLGDDVTDENAFGVLGPEDAGIKVGEGPTCAHHRVGSEHAALAVLAFLWRRRASGSGKSLAPRWPRAACE